MADEASRVSTSWSSEWFSAPAQWTDIEALLADADSYSSLQALQMQIDAQVGKDMYGTKTWFTVNGGLSRCQRCTSVALNPVPLDTRRLQFRVMVPAGSVGFLYVFAMTKVWQ